MNDLAELGIWIMLGLVCSVAIVAVFWARVRKYQMRNEIILKLLETRQSLDPETLDKLLEVPGPRGVPDPSRGPRDPRADYRVGNFIFFLIGFATLLYAFSRDAGLSYPLIALGVFAIVLAFLGWRVGDRQFRDGTLPTLKYTRDPRDPYLQGGVVFFYLGYGTMFFGIVRDAGLSYPIIGLGLLLVGMCFLLWRQGNKEYFEGRLTGTPVERDRA